MGSSRKLLAHDLGDQLRRDQEVLRAARELAAYFRGRRTEREARGALKIIKAFVRGREKIDPAKRRPLPIGKVNQAKSDKSYVKTHRRAKIRRKVAETQAVSSD